MEKERKVEFQRRESELIYNINVPKNINKIKSNSKERQDDIISKLSKLLTELREIISHIIQIFHIYI